ncbi:pseudouridine-5'-phosphate glycosidase [Microbacterium sp. QXD-8]|uniref:Pseudouridine-5'-phosphate glycosidase n=1 Tax=Microbacterium psychrotolerans TaxID=3068321 RepID=A0ABU0YZW3_9MICO|nr:pseudouridine-5'-phosphate glycosidase [Microbacterium sp. QXD-8]MDQ7877872.1 pseudouridine-5'-phosphate glycosidase [Microbacterium sp. QXD-8]
MPVSAPLVIAAEVQEAVAAGEPVLALESTIFTHGLPRPRNLDVALEAEARVRAFGVVPATIGVVDGRPTVGLSPDEIEQLSTADEVVKASVRDIPVVAVKGLSAGTTVAATGYLASRAGLRVFSTGGLGGVHRGAPQTFDESADLLTLAGLPLVVVSAGVKSILDIPLTLERLETLNLAVVGYRTTDYPGFYIADSGHDIEYSVDSPAEIAAIARMRDGLGISSTLLVANPVAAERQLDPALHDDVLARALSAANARGVSGHDTTPFLLDFLQRETGGRSLEVNVEVYRGNVGLGARIALALADATG